MNVNLDPSFFECASESRTGGPWAFARKRARITHHRPVAERIECRTGNSPPLVGRCFPAVRPKTADQG